MHRTPTARVSSRVGVNAIADSGARLMDLPYFPAYAGDWLASSSVTMMTMQAEATYWRLLCHQWRSEELPADPKALRLLTKCTPSEWRSVWAALEPHFPSDDDGKRRNARLESERGASVEKHAARVEAGKRSAAARAAKAQQSANGTPTERPTKRKQSLSNAGTLLEQSLSNAPTMLQQNTRNHNHSHKQITTSTAVAAAVVSTPATAATTAEHEPLLAQFTDPVHRDAVSCYLRAAQFPASLAADFQSQLDGLHGPNGQRVEPEVLGRAVHEMRVAGIVRPTSQATAKFVASLLRPTDVGPSKLSDEDDAAAMMARIAAGEFAHV